MLVAIMLDLYGNYVVQTALSVDAAAGHRGELVAAIKQHAKQLNRGSFGRRILDRIKQLDDDLNATNSLATN